ncbi:MAG: hypothetical protein E7270_07070 [Lachnospiraceae bacterium]|nr:hypothetical protein [Lachnospiraceae bacterium]
MNGKKHIGKKWCNVKMKWFKRRKRELDDFDKKYGDLQNLSLEPIDINSEKLEQEPLFVRNPEQRKQFVENNCEKIVEATKKIEETKKEYQLVNNYLTDIQTIEELPDNNSDKIVSLAQKIMVLDKDRRDFGNSMSKMSDRQFNCLKDYGDNIKNVLKDLEQDENYCQTVKSDMHHLQAEKAALLQERRDMKDRIHMVRGISKIAVCAYGLLIAMCMIIQLNTEVDVLPYIYGILGLALVTVVVLFTMHNSAIRNIKIAEIKLNKAIGLLNKTKLKYVNVQSRLDYMYEKFGIHSAYELNAMWGKYLQMCKEREVYRKASDKLIEAEEDLLEELKRYNIHDTEVWLQQVSALVEKKEMKKIKSSLCTRRQKLKATIEFNTSVVEKSTQAIKDVVSQDKEHAQEIMDIVDKYCG